MTQKAEQTTAVAAASMSPEAIQAAMVAAGLITPSSTMVERNRVRIDGNTFLFGGTKDEPEFRIDSPSDGSAAFRMQIVTDVDEYYGKYFDESEAHLAGRPNIANSWCKSHTAVPSQGGEHAEDTTSCRECPVSHFITRKDEGMLPIWNGKPAKKCSWMGDLEFRLLDADDTITDERIWTLSFTPTGMIEWQGSFGDKSKGYISDQSSKQKLALLALTKAAQDEVAQAIQQAADSLRQGGVLAEARILRTVVNENRFSVPSITPIDIIPVEATPALATSEEPAPATETPDDIPF